MTIQWLAGFYEGEGHACAVHGKYFNLSISQKDKKVLRRIKLRYGGRIYVHRFYYTKGGYENWIHRIVWSSHEARKISLLMLPHMQHHEKIRKLKAALKKSTVSRPYSKRSH